MRAPDTGLPSRSVTRRTTVVGPTRGGSGDIVCSTVTSEEASIRLEQPTIKKAKKQEAETIPRRKYTALRTVVPDTN